MTNIINGTPAEETSGWETHNQCQRGFTTSSFQVYDRNGIAPLGWVCQEVVTSSPNCLFALVAAHMLAVIKFRIHSRWVWNFAECKVTLNKLSPRREMCHNIPYASGTGATFSFKY